MKLYYVPYTRAIRPRWLLEELGVPYELVRLDPSKKENRQPEYLEVHPLGHVPALVDGDVRIIESAAICLYLADKFPEKKLAPPVGSKDRAAYYQWTLFTMTTIEPPLVTISMHTRFLPEEKRNPALIPEARERLNEVFTALTKQLRGRQYAAGDTFSTADVLLAATLSWGKGMGTLDGHPELLAYTQALTSRPAFQRARAD